MTLVAASMSIGVDKKGGQSMIASTSRHLMRKSSRILLNAFILATAVLIAFPGASEAKVKLWLYPDSDSPRAGGHVVFDTEFTLVVENRGRGDEDLATDVLLAMVVNDIDLFTSVNLVWPDGDETVEAADLQYGTPTRPCDGRAMPRHSWYPGDFTTVPIALELGAGETVEIDVVIEGMDGLEVHFDGMASGSKEKRGVTTCYGVVNPSGHDVTAVLGERGGGGEDDCPEVEITKSADVTWVELDDPAVYTIEVVSSEDCDPLEGVIVTEDIPTVTDGVDIFPAFTVDVAGIIPAPTSVTDDSITWELGTLDPGVPMVITVPVVFDQELADGKKIVNHACVTADGIDDPKCDRFKIKVGTASDDGEIGGPGFWCHRIVFAVDGRRPATYTVEELEAFLVDIVDQSAVFWEIFDTGELTDIELAEMLLCLPQLAESDADRLVRHLLTLWFNIMSGRVDPAITVGDLCPGDEGLPEGADETMTVEEVVTAAETDLLAEALEAEMWKDIIDYINSARMPVDGSCEDEAMSTPRRKRGRRLGHRPH
jgi:hypothetical protein